MKLKSWMHLLGLRPRPRSYGFDLREYILPTDGRIEFAQWLHPREGIKTITQEEVDSLRGFLRPGDVAIDIGAHSGDSTIPIGLAVGPQGCVLALEPNMFVYPVLAKNAELNAGKTNIVPLMFAATPEDGAIEFAYSDAGFCNGGCHEGISKWRHGHAFRLPVEGKNLDAFLRREHPDLLPRVRYIKVDAEGYDYTVLQSLSNLIAERRPFIRAEVYKYSPPELREEMIHFLHGHRYSVHRMRDQNDFQGERLEPSDMMRWTHFDIFCTPDDMR